MAAAGFIVSRWLLSVCNVPTLCGWLAWGSLLLAVVYIGASLRSPTGSPLSALGRPAARLLALTAALDLVSRLPAATAASTWSWPALLDAVDVLAWAWALYGGLVLARWLWGDGRTPAVVAERPFPRHLLLSGLIVLVLGLQVWALFRSRPTIWPFIDYPLYNGSHSAPARAIHYRLYGLTAQEPVTFFELTAEALGMSWFPYHTQLIPQLFEGRPDALETLERRLEDSDVEPLQLVLPERTAFVLVDGELREYPERRVVPLPSADADHEERADPLADHAPLPR